MMNYVGDDAQHTEVIYESLHATFAQTNNNNSTGGSHSTSRSPAKSYPPSPLTARSHPTSSPIANSHAASPSGTNLHAAAAAASPSIAKPASPGADDGLYGPHGADISLNNGKKDSYIIREWFGWIIKGKLYFLIFEILGKVYTHVLFFSNGKKSIS